jgi:6-pyruvoyltetrahydropterin/6-carboxytetrahydropterin synthase
MFSLGVTDFVMIAHSLAGEFFGPAQRMHGATLGVEVELRCAELDPHGVVVDIGVMRQLLRKVLEPLDYQNLDEHPAFPPRGSTTERIAAHICNSLAQALTQTLGGALPKDGVLKVLVRESPAAWVAFETKF